MAVMPCGIFFVGSMITCFSESGAACSAAIMIFLLFGRTKTTSAGTASIAWSRSSVEGFIVWPPRTSWSTPRSVNTLSKPSPAATATNPNFFSGSAITRSRGASAVPSTTFAVCCSRMFSIFTVSSGPNFSASSNARLGWSVCTWTLIMSSSSTTTRESPILFRMERIRPTLRDLSRRSAINSVQ